MLMQLIEIINARKLNETNLNICIKVNANINNLAINIHTPN